MTKDGLPESADEARTMVVTALAYLVDDDGYGIDDLKDFLDAQVDLIFDDVDNG